MAQDDMKTGTALVGEAARRFSRRILLKNAAALGVAAASGPLYVKRAFASSGELNILCWTDELPDPVLSDFKAATGITVKKTPFSSNEEQINKMQATLGQGFDLCMPSFNRAKDFQFLEVLKPFDESRIDASAYLPSLLKASSDLWTWDGLYHLPHVWGTEALAWNTDANKLTYADSSYGLLWDPKYAGKVEMRTYSGLLGLGLWMDATGKLSTNRMLDSYKDEATMRKIYDELTAYAVAHKSQIRQFWDSTDSIQAGFRENGCTMGQTWDGPVKAMIKNGEPMVFMAPKEGALTWMDGFALSTAAENLDEVYAFLDYIEKPEVAGKIAALSNYNAVIKGADAFVPEADKKLFRASYPEDSLDKLWWYPPAPAWFNAIRNQYAEKFQAA
ncbi:extracellular solute-binding protein [Jiella sonneratiae]|uniref:Extracellular solute-binding protein n=1 Tax=Jiella sonneratiae TaxID=2816856 RepID=A0ABS3J993_9HYPH|nr:extracellular solute-binding protein [Jiella sonneratiae]MBO0906242.1 extracellular solute-binding protein [Jiella sonneratiae]